MTTNNSGVKRYELEYGHDSMMRKVNRMQESEDGVYIRFDDYEALQAECERLRKDADTERQPSPDMSALAEILREAAAIIEAIHPEFAPRNMRWPIIDELEGFALMLDLADGWIPTNGKKPDLPVDTLIDIKFANGDVDIIHNADLWRWTHEGVANDITHYRIHQTVSSVQEEPVGWQFYQNGKWQYGDDRIKDHRKNTEEAVFPVRDVYAAQQPAEQKPEVLAKGYFHPLPDENDYEFHDAEDFPSGSDCPDCVPAMIVRDGVEEAQFTPAPNVSALVEMVEVMVELGGFGKAYAMDIARAALAAHRKGGSDDE